MTRKRRRQRGAPKPLDRESQKSDIPLAEGAGGADLRIYQEKPGEVPFLDFVAALKPGEKAAVTASLELLKEMGHLLRPPHNEHLGDRIYYLRILASDGTYRLFYWPFGKGIVILGHGFSKKTRACPAGEINRVRRMRDRFLADPEAHTYKEDPP